MIFMGNDKWFTSLVNNEIKKDFHMSVAANMYGQSNANGISMRRQVEENKKANGITFGLDSSWGFYIRSKDE